MFAVVIGIATAIAVSIGGMASAVANNFVVPVINF